MATTFCAIEVRRCRCGVLYTTRDNGRDWRATCGPDCARAQRAEGNRRAVRLHSVYRMSGGLTAGRPERY